MMMQLILKLHFFDNICGVKFWSRFGGKQCKAYIIVILHPPTSSSFLTCWSIRVINGNITRSSRWKVALADILLVIVRNSPEPLIVHWKVSVYIDNKLPASITNSLSSA